MRIGLHYSAPALQLIQMRLTTNINEAANRAISATLPKNVKFSRNAHERLCSVIDRMNCGAGISLLRKLESVQCPVTRGWRVAHAAKQIQNKGEYQRAYYSREPSVKLHARYAKFRRVSNYFAAKRNRRQMDIYKKCHLDMTAARTKGKRQASQHLAAVKPVLKTRRQRRTQQTHGEHTYSLRSLRHSNNHNYSDK